VTALCDFSTVRCSVDSCRLEQMTFNKYRKYNYKYKHMHDKIYYITQSERGFLTSQTGFINYRMQRCI